MRPALAVQALDPREFRRAAGRFATGVALVTSPGGESLIVSSFSAVSFAPALVAFSVNHCSLTWRRMRRSRVLAINVLPVDIDDVRDRARPGADRLAGLDVHIGPDAIPRLSDALAILHCTLSAEHPAGDHTIVVSEVVDATLGAGGAPLVAFGGAFGTFAGL